MAKTKKDQDLLSLILKKVIPFSEPLEAAEKRHADESQLHSDLCNFTESGTHYHRYGNIKSSKKLILLHAMGGNLHNSTPIVSELSRECDVYALDLPWHGLTTHTKSDEGAYSDFYVAWLQDFIDHTALTKPTIVGHSLGARVGTMYALKNTDKVGSLVALTPGYSPSFKGLVAMESMVLRMLASKYGHIVDKQVITLFLHEMLLNKHKDAVTCLDYAIEEIIRDQSTHKMVGILEALKWFDTEPFDFDSFRTMAGTLPITVLCGQKDLYCPNRELFDIQAPNFNLEIIKRSGHLMPLEHPKLIVNRILASANYRVLAT